MAPESLQGSDHVDHRADIYAVGVIHAAPDSHSGTGFRCVLSFK